MSQSRVSIAKCRDYGRQAVNAALLKSVALLGGISSFVKPHSRVLVKPNLLMAKTFEEYAVCTHPEVIRAVVRMLKDAGSKVVIGDGPAAWGGHCDKVREVYEVTGVAAIAREEGVGLDDFAKNKWRGKFPLAAILDNVDHVISVPKFKTHSLTVLTAAVKNLYGLLKSSYKTKFHSDFFDPEEFAGVLVDIYEQVRPVLTIVDGIIAQEGNGPGTGGSRKEAGILVSSADAVALDSVLAFIMGIQPHDVPSTRIAAERKLGVMSIRDIEVLGDSLDSVAISPFELADSTVINFLPRPLSRIIGRLISFRPQVIKEKCRKCSSCIKGCPEGVMYYGKNGSRIIIDYKKCIRCFCCQEICPWEAIRTRKSWLARMIGL